MAGSISAKTVLRSRSAGVVKLPKDELSLVAEELAAARELFGTFDPDSPPWSVEPEMHRLELRLAALTNGRP
jgi:hypothetical protein